MIYFWVPLCALHSGSLVSLVFFNAKNDVVMRIDECVIMRRCRIDSSFV